VHLAADRDWRDKGNVDSCGVVYFALERAGLLERSLLAYQIRDDVPSNIPLIFSPALIDLGDLKSVEKIVATVKTAEYQFGCSVGLIAIDTYNKGIAAGGRDEDKAKDQNAVNANMRRILGQVNVHIAGVGHMGKDENKGERGSNARLADVDLLVKVSGDPIRSVEIDKANDQPDGALTTFTLDVVKIGDDEDGDPIETTILSRDATLGPCAAKPRGKKTASQHTILKHAILDAYDRLADGVAASSGLNGKSVRKISVESL